MTWAQETQVMLDEQTETWSAVLSYTRVGSSGEVDTSGMNRSGTESTVSIDAVRRPIFQEQTPVGDARRISEEQEWMIRSTEAGFLPKAGDRFLPPGETRPFAVVTVNTENDGLAYIVRARRGAA